MVFFRRYKKRRFPPTVAKSSPAETIKHLSYVEYYRKYFDMRKDNPTLVNLLVMDIGSLLCSIVEKEALDLLRIALEYTTSAPGYKYVLEMACMEPFPKVLLLLRQHLQWLRVTSDMLWEVRQHPQCVNILQKNRQRHGKHQKHK